MKFYRTWELQLALVTSLSIVAVLLVHCSLSYAKDLARAATLDELVRLFDSSACKECHEEIYEQWEKSHHSRSLMGINDQMLLVPLLKRIGKPGMPLEQLVSRDLPCFKCHYPQAKYGTDFVAREIAIASLKDDRATVRKLNIGCLVCHNEKAVVHGRPEEGVVYGNRDFPDHEGRRVKTSPLLKNSLMCGQCHGLGPVLDSVDMPVQCATLYGSYLHAYIPAGGTKTCQECHMKGGDHYMPPNFNNKEELSALLRESLPMQVEALAYTYHPKEDVFSPMVVVKTKITSLAGHRIPDG